MSDIAADNFVWAAALIDALAAGGAEQAVISPGSRSTPLALACLRHPRLEIHVVVDERSAAFFALGLAKARNRPAILVCTSGSAPAHWFPAVIEADMGAVPLILLSADRPPELRGCGANQAIDQIGLFGAHVRAFHELPCADAAPDMLRYLRALAVRAAEQSRWPLAGPVHLNVPLREPLVPIGALPASAFQPVAATSHPLLALPAAEVQALAGELGGKRGLIVCGWGAFAPGFAAAVAGFAARMACPILADPLSNLRFGAHDRSAVLTRYDAFLRRPGTAERLCPEWVLHLGAMPVSKTLQRYFDQLGDVPTWVIDPGGRWPDPLHRAIRMLRADAENLCRALCAAAGPAAPAPWLAAFSAEEARAARLAEIDPPPEAEIVSAVLDLLPENGTVFVGNSMAIRDFDAYSGAAAKPLRLAGNRGASGIDGNLAAALGLSAGGAGPLLAVLGDLALHHDLNSLSLARGRDAVLVVIDNGGGGIFEYLPQAALEDFERAWLTPAGVDFAHAAAAYGIAYRSTDAAGLRVELAQALQGGAHLIAVKVERKESVARHRGYWAAVGAEEK